MARTAAPGQRWVEPLLRVVASAALELVAAAAVGVEVGVVTVADVGDCGSECCCCPLPIDDRSVSRLAASQMSRTSDCPGKNTSRRSLSAGSGGRRWRTTEVVCCAAWGARRAGGHLRLISRATNCVFVRVDNVSTQNEPVGSVNTLWGLDCEVM